MIAEFFDAISNQIESWLQSQSDSKKIKIRIANQPVEKNPATGKNVIRLAMLRFGNDIRHVGFPQGAPSDKLYNAFSFYVTIDGGDYRQTLELIEQIAAMFEKKPFLQLKVEEHEYECGISAFEIPFSDINHFWIAQQSKHQPVLFYQARVSEV